MKTHVTVVPVDQVMIVDGVGLRFTFQAPATLHAVQWHNDTGHTEWTDGGNQPLTPDDYDTVIAPFVALWETEKARLKEEANRPPEPPTPPTLEEAKAGKFAELAAAFARAEASGHFMSSLGFEVDATERANRDVAGLVTLMESTGQVSALFCDYGNAMRPVSLADLKTLQLELIAHGQLLYARKWALREAIEAAESVEAVQGIEISFDDLPAPVAPVAPDVLAAPVAPEAQQTGGTA